MYDGNYAQLMAEYNRWMNERIYAACAKLTDEERKRDRGAFFKSIHATLDHILWGDLAWLSRFTGKIYTTRPLGDVLHEDFAELRSKRAQADRAIVEWARGVTAAWLNESMTWNSTTYGFTQTQIRWVLVAQMFNHATHHRGQVTTLLSQQGIDPGVTDLTMVPLLHA